MSQSCYMIEEVHLGRGQSDFEWAAVLLQYNLQSMLSQAAPGLFFTRSTSWVLADGSTAQGLRDILRALLGPFRPSSSLRTPVDFIFRILQDFFLSFRWALPAISSNYQPFFLKRMTWMNVTVFVTKTATMDTPQTLLGQCTCQKSRSQ